MHRFRAVAGLLITAGVVSACAGAGGLRVAPEEIPDLETALAGSPDDPSLRVRYASALFAAGRCDDARSQAEAAAAVWPENAVTPLVQGQCLEAAGRLADAVEVYGAFLRVHSDAPGAAAVRGRRLLAERALVGRQAREALLREAEISARPPEVGVVAVLPGRVAGGDEDRHAALARGLAQMLISDLALLGRLRLVERIEIAALLDELERAAVGRLDPGTAPRVGRLVRAESVIQNLLVIDDGEVRIEALVTRGSDSPSMVESTSGSLGGLLEMEKDVALMLADRLAGPLSPAEERAILQNGPASMAAFLDWADGLILEDRGDFAAAAQAYRRAARADGRFTDAADRSRTAAAAVEVIGRSPTQVIALGSQARRAERAVSGDAIRAALEASAFEVAPLGPELALGGPGGVGGALTPGALQSTPALPLDVVLRILVRIPR